MVNAFGFDEIQPIWNGVNYNPDTGNYENGNHIEKHAPDFSVNLNPNFKDSKAAVFPTLSSTNNEQNLMETLKPITSKPTTPKKRSPNHNKNSLFSPSKETPNKCYQCASVGVAKNIPGAGNCDNTVYCLDPDLQNEQNWFMLNCVIKCPETKPYCYSYKTYVADTLIHVDRGCAEFPDEILEPLDGTANYGSSARFIYDQVLDREICEDPELTPTKTKNCEFLCTDDLCNSSVKFKFNNNGFDSYIILLFIVLYKVLF